MTNIKRKKYMTPDGFSDLYMESDGEYLIGLRFSDGEEECTDEDVPVFDVTAKWLDGYFNSKPDGELPKIKIEGLTPFRRRVLNIIKAIPYGETMTYGEVAKKISGTMSARAVGSALGWNPVCIIIPCHRVVGSGGRITGYSGGIENKVKLLEREKHIR